MARLERPLGETMSTDDVWSSSAKGMESPPPPPPQVEFSDESPKSRLVALILCLLLGVFGVHRFYVGKVGTGVLQLLTLGGFGIWVIIDLILILTGTFRDIDRRPLLRW